MLQEKFHRFSKGSNSGVQIEIKIKGATWARLPKLGATCQQTTLRASQTHRARTSEAPNPKTWPLCTSESLRMNCPAWLLPTHPMERAPSLPHSKLSSHYIFKTWLRRNLRSYVLQYFLKTVLLGKITDMNNALYVALPLSRSRKHSM